MILSIASMANDSIFSMIAAVEAMDDYHRNTNGRRLNSR
jgi:hypothetical protein